MLAHLADRPLNLHRFPDGADAPGFWQKAIPRSAPGWLTRWHESGVDERKGRTANDHLVADGVAALAWLANQAAFEVHAWTSTCADPEHPTFALIDIDPGPATTWDETITLARLFRTALDHLGILGQPKTTGSRGIQVWIPLTRGRYGFAETCAWVERLSHARRGHRPGPGELGVVHQGPGRQGTPGLHAERIEQDPRRPLRGPPQARGTGVDADHLGRAGRPRPAQRPMDAPELWSAWDTWGDLFAPVQRIEQDLPAL